MKRTGLYEKHLARGAKMVEFGGFEMPVSYSSIKEEHRCVRQKAGVFDVSHMGEFWVEGPQAQALLQKICSNDIAKLIPGKAQYNYWPNRQGGVIDDLIVYQIEKEKYLLVVNASNIDKDWEWLKGVNKEFGATLTNASDALSLLAVQGPLALQIVQTLTEKNLSELSFYAHCTTTIAGITDVLVATTGYTGEGGVEIYCHNKDVEKLWEALFLAGEKDGLQPIGLAARDTLRLEMGYCLYGNEIDENTSPIAAGLGWVSKPETGSINSEQMAQELQTGTAQKLVGFVMEQRGIPRQGHPLVNPSGEIIGRVTSGTQSPSLEQGIGLGYIESDWSKEGTKIAVEIRGKQQGATIVKLPFYRP